MVLKIRVILTDKLKICCCEGYVTKSGFYLKKHFTLYERFMLNLWCSPKE